jgi:hypothetical protein
MGRAAPEDAPDQLAGIGAPRRWEPRIVGKGCCLQAYRASAIPAGTSRPWPGQHALSEGPASPSSGIQPPTHSRRM